VILTFTGISQNFFIGKVMDRVYGSQDHDWLLVYNGLMSMGWRGRFRAREVVMVARRERASERERERRRSSGFSSMMPLGGGVAQMATRRCSTEAVGGAPMGRWFRAEGEEIGAGVGAVDNGGALVAPFIGS
jgi:hypothetical protein